MSINPEYGLSDGLLDWEDGDLDATPEMVAMAAGPLVGYYAAVVPCRVRETTKGGIILHHTERNKIELRGYMGRLVQLGPDFWEDAKFGRSAQPKLGDYVTYRHYIGAKDYIRKPDGSKLLIINIIDEDIIRIVGDITKFGTEA